MIGWTQARGVPTSADLTRVLELPRRRWEDEDHPPLTESLKTPQGTQTLRPAQEASLREIKSQRGLLGGQRVGAGKTLTTFLAATVLGSERPLLLVPASLRDKTHFELGKAREHWKIHPRLRVVGYEELSLLKNKNLLEDYLPDLIVADEVHKLKRLESGRTRRVNRYLEHHPDTVFVGLSGTITSKSLHDYWHLSLWALREGAPLPLKYPALQDWACALDAKVRPGERLRPGALEKFGTPVRDGFRRRLTETPGVVNTSGAFIECSLRIRPFDFDTPEKINRALHTVERTWETPSGIELMEAVDVWNTCRQLSMGFYYEWDPQPPKDWLAARKEWAKYVRHRLATNRSEIDTELQVRLEAEEKDLPVWFKWKAVMDTFTPNPVARWMDKSLLEAAARWLEKEQGIVWVEHIEVGRELAKVSGYPYFGGGARASKEILTHTGPMICSMAAHSEGKNLQRFHRNLVLTPPSTGKVWEQMMGRTHREGQPEDTVQVQVAQHTEHLRQALRDAIEDSKYIETTQGSPQKLLYGDFTWEP